MSRSRGIKPVSDRRRDRQPERDAVVALVHRRDVRCQGNRHHHTCSTMLEVHEIIPRSAWADGIYDADNCILLCRTAHRWVTDHTNPASEIGLHVKRSTVDRIGRKAALVEAASRRC